MVQYAVSFVSVSVYRKDRHNVFTRNNFFNTEESAFNYLCKDIVECLFTCERMKEAVTYLDIIKDFPHIDKLNEVLKYFEHEGYDIYVDDLEFLLEIGTGKIKYLSEDKQQSYIWNINMVITPIWDH